jgi:predicted nucleotidyltransferase
MADRKVLRILRYLERCLGESGLNVSKMILFGSHARGEAVPDSDIDVAIISEDFRGRGIFERSDLIGDAHERVVEKFVVPLDIVTMTPEELERGTSLVAQFVSQGRPV